MADTELIEDAEVVEEEDNLPVPVAREGELGLFRTEEPDEVVLKATAIAKSLARIVRDPKLDMVTNINGREHVRVEGWTLLGSMMPVAVHGIIEWTRPLERDGTVIGWEARAEARTITGDVVGAAEAECLRLEKQWTNRDDYALRSMAQTRALSKALRMPLGFVMKLAGFDPTPAEEMVGAARQEREEKQAGRMTKEQADEIKNLVPFAAAYDPEWSLKGIFAAAKQKGWINKRMGEMSTEQADEIVTALKQTIADGVEAEQGSQDMGDAE